VNSVLGLLLFDLAFTQNLTKLKIEMAGLTSVEQILFLILNK